MSSKENISSIIHDIRNPLNNISLNAELGKLLLSNTGNNSKEIETLFDTILAESLHAANQLSRLTKEN